MVGLVLVLLLSWGLVDSDSGDTVRTETLVDENNKLEQGTDAGFVLLIAAVLVVVAAAERALAFCLRPKASAPVQRKIRNETVEVNLQNLNHKGEPVSEAGSSKHNRPLLVLVTSSVRPWSSLQEH
ncbi:uncharacterized protein V6R79_003278 [Siganus canaliculatus]